MNFSHGNGHVFLFIGCSEACGKLQYLATGQGGGNTRSGAALFLQLNINKNRMDQHKVRLRCPTKDILSSWWCQLHPGWGVDPRYGSKKESILWLLTPLRAWTFGTNFICAALSA